MPVFLRTSNLKFAIRTNDHPPAHVHVLGPDAEAKIDLKSLDIISAAGFSKKDITRIISFLKDKKDILIKAWEEYHED
ncbi:MAG TPA: DUF4160 domain-containing protein [Spirochaetota bacterium]|nr:DUF4160 domain-containing protein [Spirochaetota bacterium]